MVLSRRASRRARHRGSSGEERTIKKREGREKPQRAERRGNEARQHMSAVKEEAERAGEATTRPGEARYGDGYGEGFGVGAGRGAESGSQGLEGASLREKDYRGLRGSRIGAPVGPDGLKEDTSQDKRPDPKPENEGA